ncbi:hypothetical protein DJ010_02025 [Nocardioides silvaticus]|uniref:GerMN domain-containing protein n=1 Tax=Nocardioides silvaticus TaxID=2201891 RepID=A0A316TME1_9ACTN|nr:LpqB family beta-propeller domain-containing protein [Nocardioides silvaticus]PWN04439.1 hypothetical protein DJ010_02025 [Nocardioides silvaticus]
MSRAARAAAALVLVVLLTGCVGLPRSGPVIDANVPGDQSGDPVSSFDGRSPQPGDSRLAIVNGFLEAMMAWPISTSAAKEYLAEDAAEEWDPTSTVVYSDLATPQERGSSVSIRMRDAALLDESGGWRGAVPADRSTLTFQLTVEDGEFRILNPMDALVVRTSWFHDRYRQASLYYFDPTGEVLVPEPVFVPVGDTFATSLVTALLAGPPPRLRDVVTSYLPDNLTVGLSVPVIDGVATLDLSGDALTPSPAVAELILAQLAATVRQEPTIRALRVTIGGELLDPPGSETTYDVRATDDYDAADTGSAGVLYGLRRGRVVAGSFDDLREVDGPLGREPHDYRSMAVSPVGDRIAAVSADGREVTVAPLRSPRNEVDTLPAGGTAFARPAWDASGRLWLLDRRPGGARVLVSEDGVRVREVQVFGVSGSAARRILVSRDGTRLVALVSRPGGDQLVSARVVLDQSGRIARIVESTVIRSFEGDQRAIDVAWTGPAEIALLLPARPGELFEVQAVSVDGATVEGGTPSTFVPGRAIGLAGEPDPETPVYAVARDELGDVRTGVRYPVKPVRELDYGG